MILLSALDDQMVRLPDGRPIGRVHEVVADGGAVTALDCGPGGWVERLTGHGRARRIPWSAVREVRADAIIVDLS